MRAAILLAFAVAAATDPAAAPRPPVSEPGQITLALHEGTSMAAALSPDGRTLAIDLLGSLWTLPATGGSARRITDEYMDARQPVWSPDGQRIAFQAYRDGTWHIWTVNPDGSALKELTSGPYDDREPSWSPDGDGVAFSSDRSGNYDIWVLQSGAGTVRQITHNAANDFAPAWSPDGQTIAFVSDRTDGRGVWKVNAATSAETLVAAAAGSVNAPSWSPDGSRVIYAVIAGNESRLMLEGQAVTSREDVFPFRVQWASPDELIYTADGKIKKRSIRSGQVGPIEFSATVSFTRTPYQRKRRDFDSRAARPVRGIMAPVLSPDATQVAFAALGDLWVMPIGGTPRRVTHDRFVEMDPAWSPDGRLLAFSSDRSGTMDLWVHDMQSGAERLMSSDATMAAWSPDGAQLVFVKHDGAIGVTDKSAPVHAPLHDPGRPTWSPDGTFVVVSMLHPYSSRYREGTNELVQVSMRGAPDRTLDPVPNHSIGTRENDGPVWSPDGSKMAFVMDGLLQVIPTTRSGEAAGPPRQISSDVADSPSWAADSRHLLYQAVDRLRLVDVNNLTSVDVPVNLTWQPAIPRSRVVVHAGRLFDGRSPSLRSAMDIVIGDNRIEQVIEHRADLHTGRVVDATEDVVMPGLIEMHTHLRKAYGEMLGRIWLSYGITSIRNPASNPYEAIEDRESSEAGVRVAPRIFTTGAPFDGARIYYAGGVSVNDDAQLRLELERAGQLDYDLIKTYVRLPDLLQKQVIDFAHRHGTPVTSHELYPAVASGADGVEHIRGTSRRGYSPKVTALNFSYRDVIDLLIASKMTLTPTLGIQGWFPLVLARDPSRIADPRFRTLFPPWVVSDMDRLARNRPGDLAAREAAAKPYGKTVVDVVRGGGRVIAGTDSPIFPYALAFHTELELFVESGLTPFEALQTATTNAAEALGEGADLGSIERGKLADLVVVGGDPLADIKNARKVRLVIENGEVYGLDDLLKRVPYQSTPQ
jgi:Tol biopolymer transport system component